MTGAKVQLRAWGIIGTLFVSATCNLVAAEADGPEANGSAAYAGSESCRNCHSIEYNLWRQSHHALAERPLETNIDKNAFAPSRVVKSGSQTSTVCIQNGHLEIVTAGFNTNVAPYQVDGVIGVDPIEQFLTAAGGGRWQVQEI